MIGEVVAVREIPVSASIDKTLSECLLRGLRIRSSRELAGKPGSHHYHLAIPGRPGTLELSEHGEEVWFSVNERRDCGWVTSTAEDIATSFGEGHRKQSR
jgi:hypothetical protein